MDKILDLYKQVADDKSKRADVESVFAMLSKKVKNDCPDAYRKAFLKMHNAVYDGHFCERMAIAAVAAMENVDGTHGAHWTKEQATNIMQQNGYSFDKNDFYYTINVFYSDYAKVLNSSEPGIYAKLAAAYISDPDAPRDKVFKIYLATHDID